MAGGIGNDNDARAAEAKRDQRRSLGTAIATMSTTNPSMMVWWPISCYLLAA